MKNMRVPIRPAPPVEEARLNQKYFKTTGVENSTISNSFMSRLQPPKTQAAQQQRKKPPPRPPPPNLDKVKSNSAWNLPNLARPDKEQQQHTRCLIDWSPPTSPNASTKRAFAPFVPNSGAGSISSSFSSSTSSLASSKKSFDYDTAFNIYPWTNTQKQGPTIIRPQILKKPKVRIESPVSSLSSYSNSPVPSIPPSLPPPPSPPKGLAAEEEPEIAPFAIALYQYFTGHPDDLNFEVNDIVYLTERINDEWYRGRVDVQEGMFPATFVDVQVPLPQQKPKPKFTCIALHTYTPNMDGYLNIFVGNTISVLYRVDSDWCMGEMYGKVGQFPINHVDNLRGGI